MSGKPARVALYVAFLLSGVTALVYQVLWSRYLTLFVGGTSVAHTIVLATFMAGLAFGNALFGRLADRRRLNRLRLYALLEVGIGLSCLLFPLVFEALSRAYLSLASSRGAGAGANNVLKVALAAAVMFVPCAFMGGTLPVLARYVVQGLRGLGVKVSWLYFVNTAGAVLGCLLGGFYVIERWGLEAGMVGSALVNLAIGGAFYVAGGARRGSGTAPAEREEPPGAEEPAYSRGQMDVAFWSIGMAGAVSMLYELCWTRVLILSTGSSVHSFTTMLVSFISGIAIGSALVARLMRRPRNALVLFAACEMGIALSILLPMRWYERLPYAFHRLGSWLSHSPDTYPLYLLAQVLLAALVMLVPTTLIGAALPLASSICVDRMEVLGRRVGGVFSVNTVGTVAGAALTGFVLLPRLGLERTLLLGCTLSAALGLVLAAAAARGAAGVPRRGLLAGVAATAAALALAFAQPGWDARLMQAGLFRWGTMNPLRDFAAFRAVANQGRFLYAKDGMDGTVVVHEADALNRNVRVNGKVDASVADMGTQLLVGHLPMFLHPQPRRVMVVGLGCGATAAAVLRHPGVTADVAEILPEMVEAAAWFEPWNDKVLRNPRMALHVLDAREFLLLTRRRYDVIVSEPTNVWVPGVANLFTRDFYRVVRSRLEPGGMFAQWIHGYAAAPEMVASVVATLREEFPYVSLWGADDTDLILVASERRPDFDPQRFGERFERVRPIDGLPSPPRTRLAPFLHPVLFLAHQIGTDAGMQVAWPRGSAPVYRDRQPRLEFQAARAQFVAEPFKVRAHIDERRSHLASEPLFLEEYLARYPLDQQGRLALANLLTSLGGWHADLGAAVDLGLLASGGGPSELLARLPDAVLSRLIVSRQLGAEIDRAAQPPPGLCGRYLEAERVVLAAGRSVFGRLDTAALERRVDRCIAAAPGGADTLRVGLTRALAEAGATDAAIHRIRAIAGDGVLDRLQPGEAAAVFASGSALLLPSAGAEALAWAERALQLDPRNATAARIVSALRTARPGVPPRATSDGASAPPG